MHQIQYKDYHCSTSENKILKDLDTFAFDPQETIGYHGGMTFHRDITCKTRDEAMKKLKTLIKGDYDDHAIFYKDGRKKYWLCKVEWHC